MITRLKRIKDKDQRKLIGVILAGKMTAVVILLGLMKGASWRVLRRGRRYITPTTSSAPSTRSGCW